MRLISPQLLAISSLLLGITGCGSDNKSEPDPVEATQQITGIAVDGYLAMAKACIDVNNNFQCDGDSEYQVLTDKNGRFDIVAPEDLAVKAPLLITTSVGITIDSDHPEQTINQAFYLLSDYKKPAVVSPLTTLVYAKAQSLGDSAQAEKVLMQQLGLTDTSMLYSDFIAAKNDQSLTAEQRQKHSNVHILSQVITDIIAQGLAQSATNTSDDEKPKVTKLFTEKLASLPAEKISEQVDDAITTGKDTSTLAKVFLAATPSLIVSKNEVDLGEITPVIVPDPVTPDPVTPDPVTPDPVTPDPVTPDPVTPDPVTPDPVTPDPVTPDPVTPDPVTPDPVTPDPVTPDPVTPDPVTPDPVTPPTIINPAAPTNAVVNDAANTFGWTLVTGYSQISDYQYSSDNGTNWHDVNANPLLLTNQYYPAGTVQVRVKADSKTSRNAGAILASSTAYYLVPIAPNNGAVTNGDLGTSSTFAFDLVPDFSQLSNYQYSSDNGKTWQAVTVNPIVLTEKTYAINQVQVRVTNNLAAGNLAGTTLSNQEAFTPNLGPAPKAVTIQYMYKNNGIRWQMLGQFPEIEHYEYTNDHGVTWQGATSKTQHVGHQAYARADVGVRVKELANGQGAAAGEISWVADSDDDSLFVALPYTWMNKAKESESLTTYGSWNTSETSCLIDHNAPTPTYWIKINSSYGSDAETKITEAINKKACGISDWQLLSESELITLAQTEADSELADFEGSYDKFFTKNDSDQLIMIKNAVVQGSYSSYESAGILLRWQYPGASQAIININALITKLQTEIASNTSDYDTARLDADALLASYTSATSVANYLAVNNNLVASQTSLTTGATLVNAQLVTSTNDVNSLSFLASFVSQDTLATAVEKQAAQAAVTLATTELTKQKNNNEQLISLQQQLNQLEQTLININAALASKTDLDSSTAALTTAHASYPAAINALGGSEQYNLAMQAATNWYQVNEQFTLANKQLTQYQSLLNALPSALHVDALAELTLTQSNLDAAVLPFSEAGFINDHQSIKQAFEAAYQAGFVTTVADAMVGTHFAKLDLAGHYMPTSATFQQGWRCVADLRHNDKSRIWSIMEKGSKDSVDNVAYVGGSGQNLTEAGGLQEQYNSNSICGFDDWTIPTMDLLKSLSTVDYSGSYTTIDNSVFPHHQGVTTAYYYYWSNQSASSNTKHTLYQYKSAHSGYGNGDETTLSNAVDGYGEDNYLTFARLYRQKQQQLLDNDGNVVTDIADAFCAKDQSGLIWQLPKTADVSSRYQTVAKITGLNDDGTVENNNIANELNAAPQPLCGKTNWQLPTLAQLQSLYTSPLNHDFFQHWTVSSDDSNDRDYYLARDIGSYSRNRCLSLNGSENSSGCSRKSYNGAPPYQYTYMMISEPTKAVPAAPTNGVVVDSADINSFGWDYVSDFPTPSDYQYTIDGGVKWQDVTTNPQLLDDQNIDSGDVQVRVKAQPLKYIPVGEVLASTVAYTSLKTCTGFNKDGVCYTLSDVSLNHDNAIANCQASGAELLSKDSSVNKNDIATNLALSTSSGYWLKEVHTSNDSFSLIYNYGNWGPDSYFQSKSKGTLQQFICAK